MFVLLSLNFHVLFYKMCKLCLRISVSYVSSQYTLRGTSPKCTHA
jgi:hypothetical protein